MEPVSRLILKFDGPITIGENHGFDLLEVARKGHACGHLAAAKSIVRFCPLYAVGVSPLSLCLLAIEEDNSSVEFTFPRTEQ